MKVYGGGLLMRITIQTDIQKNIWNMEVRKNSE